MTNGILKDTAYLNGIAQTTRIERLSDDQEQAISNVVDFLDGPGKAYVIGGVAGSGKSSIIPYLVLECERRCWSVEVCAPTGKAAMVLKRKGIVNAHTLHSFLYTVEIVHDKDGTEIATFVKKPPSMFYDVNLLIVDEASMITRDLYDYISSLPFKTLYIGDHFQLPPVGDDFNIMLNPDFRMERILRQNEGNPIVQLAEIVRNGGKLPLGRFGDSVHTRVLNEDDLLNYDEIIVWTNQCKDAMNRLVRSKLGYPEGLPQVEDKMIVRVNSAKYKVFNGQIVYLCNPGPVRCRDGKWKLSFIDELAHNDVFVAACTNDCVSAKATVHLPKEELDRIRFSTGTKYNSRKSAAAVHLDWGYAVTCHAAQGSSWRNIAVIDEQRMHFSKDWNRWMYTAITRAEETVTVYSGDFSRFFK